VQSAEQVVNVTRDSLRNTQRDLGTVEWHLKYGSPSWANAMANFAMGLLFGVNITLSGCC
jgi:hypothetical protein